MFTLAQTFNPSFAWKKTEVFKINGDDDDFDWQVDSFEPATEIRALIEGQFMAKRVHAENIGYNLGE